MLSEPLKGVTSWIFFKKLFVGVEVCGGSGMCVNMVLERPIERDMKETGRKRERFGGRDGGRQGLVNVAKRVLNVSL